MATYMRGNFRANYLSYQASVGASRGTQQGGSPEVHDGIMCDGCGANPIRGIRWKCISCPDHDVCNTCKSTSASLGHSYRIVKQTASSQSSTPSNTSCKGCGQSPIQGVQSKCQVCPNLELCHNCCATVVTNGSHPHPFQPCNTQTSSSTSAQSQTQAADEPDTIIFTPQETDPNIIALAVSQDVPITQRQAAILRNALADLQPGHETVDWYQFACRYPGKQQEYYWQHPEQDLVC